MSRRKIVRRTLADGSIKEYSYEPKKREPTPRTVGALVLAYQKSSDFKKKRPNTQKTYLRAMGHILDEYRDVALSALKRRHVRALHDKFEATPALANQVKDVFAILLQFAIELEYITSNPAARIKPFQQGEHRRWTNAEISFALARVPEHIRRALVLLLFTGQRAGDVARMAWSDFDGSAIRVTQEKTGARLWVPCHATLKAELESWQQEKTKTTTLLANLEGRPFASGQQFSSAVSHALRAYPELDGCRAHGLRKSAAALLAEAGCSTLEIAAITGHATLKELERYTREADQLTRATSAIRKLEDYRK